MTSHIANPVIVLEEDGWGGHYGVVTSSDTVNGRTLVGVVPKDKGTCSYRKCGPATHTAVNRSPEGEWGMQHVCRECAVEIQEDIMADEVFHMPLGWEEL